MSKGQAYHTKQGKAIIAYLLQYQGQPITAAAIQQHFVAIGAPIGLATIYRHLEKLQEQGLIKKLAPSDSTAASYQYSGTDADAAHFFIKCEGCGKLTELKCSLLADAQDHIQADHGFTCNPTKSILYGTCKDCHK